MPNVSAVADGESLHLGDLGIAAHLVPGHTPGATTWTWRACQGTDCRTVVYADSLNAVSAPGFRFTGDATHPWLIDQFRKNIALVRELPCDIAIPVHPTFPLAPNGCRAHADAMEKRLEARIAEEKKVVLRFCSSVVLKVLQFQGSGSGSSSAFGLNP